METMGMGWLRDLPDVRDYTSEHDEVRKTLGKAKSVRAKAGLPASIDLRRWCSPIEDQESLGSCTANAGVGLIEYYENRAHGKYLDASRLFLYKVTRKLLHWTGNTGAFLRTTMKGMVLFGVPPEEYWPYNITTFEEPPAFCYAFAQNFQTIGYYRLDPPGIPTSQLLDQIKRCLVAGFPSMFGFTVYGSLYSATDGNIPYPSGGDKVVGGHAVCAVGYDDQRAIGGQKGALLIRNSWGSRWGQQGYGWLP